MFLKISPNSQENNDVRVSYSIKLQMKFFCEFCEIFKDNLFTEHLCGTTSDYIVICGVLTGFYANGNR